MPGIASRLVQTPKPSTPIVYLRGTLRVSWNPSHDETDIQSRVLHVRTSTVTDWLVGDTARSADVDGYTMALLTRTLRGSDQFALA
jgi:hypothetical protein